VSGHIAFHPSLRKRRLPLVVNRTLNVQNIKSKSMIV